MCEIEKYEGLWRDVCILIEVSVVSCMLCYAVFIQLAMGDNKVTLTHTSACAWATNDSTPTFAHKQQLLSFSSA